MDYRKDVGFVHGCLEIEDRWTAEAANGRKTTWYALRCECGKQVEVEARRWGKQVMDCGCGKAEGRVKRQLCVSLELRLHRRLQAYALAEGKTWSEAVGELLDAGLP